VLVTTTGIPLNNKTHRGTIGPTVVYSPTCEPIKKNSEYKKHKPI
jgi:hypothetical protein